MQQGRPWPQSVLTQLIRELLLHVGIAIEIANVTVTVAIASMMTR